MPTYDDGAVHRFLDSVLFGSGAGPSISDAFLLNSHILESIQRASLEQDAKAVHPVSFLDMFVWNNPAARLPNAGVADDFGVINGATGFGTNGLSLNTVDVKALGATNVYLRFTYVLPRNYDPGNDVEVRLKSAGMLTTVADTSATADVEAYEMNGAAGIGTDLCTTAATTINSLTLADKVFVISAGGLLPGDMLDIRVNYALNDAASGTVVQGFIGMVQMLLDSRG